MKLLNTYAEVGKKISIDESIKINPELKIAYQTEKETKQILDLAKRIVGVARHASTHAAGVVMADKPLVHYTPLQREAKGERITTQYDMYSLDLNVADNAVGLLKMDFLGLRNLTILEKAIEFVEQTEKKKIDLSELSLDDSKIYQMISQGETTGVFQLESEGMRRLAKKLKPNRFSDLSAMIALFRPGPMQFIDDFVNRKQNPLLIDYLHPNLQPILEETYGIIVYQEQVMQIAHAIAGFSLGRADILRRAMGKKKLSIMKGEKKDFISGCIKNGYSKKIAEQIFSMIERFASYGFNKAHSASYAMIAYQTAWMKTHYPIEFTAALLSIESDKSEKRMILAIDDCRRMGINILPPDINISQNDFVIEKDQQSLENKAIRFGLSAIKNVGSVAIKTIIKERKNNGPFQSLTDFCLRVDTQKVNKKVIESLTKVGAMSRFGKRSAILATLDQIRQHGEREQKNKTLGQASLFAEQQTKKIIKDKLPQIEEFSDQEIKTFEQNLLGVSLSSEPLWDREMAQKFDQKIIDLSDLSAGTKIKVLGIIDNIRVVLTRSRSQEMAFLTLMDEGGQINTIVFPKIFSQDQAKLIKGDPIVVIGKIDEREEEKSIIADQIFTLKEAQKQFSISSEEKSDFTIIIPKSTSSQVLIVLNDLLQKNPGDKKGVLILQYHDENKTLKLNSGINYTASLAKKIEDLLKPKL
jgi:DNA polymerase-3 subunit alpha